MAHCGVPICHFAMQGAREQGDSSAFAFECLLGDLALRLPYRLHQIVAQFGWAQPLEGT